MSQHQGSVTDQLEEAIQLLGRAELYDAQDWIRTRLDELRSHSPVVPDIPAPSDAERREWRKIVDEARDERDEARAQVTALNETIRQMLKGANFVNGGPVIDAGRALAEEMAAAKARAERAEKINAEYADARKWDLEALKSRLARHEAVERERDAERQRADAAERERDEARALLLRRVEASRLDEANRRIAELEAAVSAYLDANDAYAFSSNNATMENVVVARKKLRAALSAPASPATKESCDWCGTVGEHDTRACGLPDAATGRPAMFVRVDLPMRLRNDAEAGVIVSICDVLDVISQGENESQAIEALSEAIELMAKLCHLRGLKIAARNDSLDSHGKEPK